MREVTFGVSEILSEASVCQSHALWTWFDEWMSLLLVDFNIDFQSEEFKGDEYQRNS